MNRYKNHSTPCHSLYQRPIDRRENNLLWTIFRFRTTTKELQNSHHPWQITGAVYMTAVLMFSMVSVEWSILATASWESHCRTSHQQATSQQLRTTETTALREMKWVVLNLVPENTQEEVVQAGTKVSTLKSHMILSTQTSKGTSSIKSKRSTSKIRSIRSIWTLSRCQHRKSKSCWRLRKKWKTTDARFRPSNNSRHKCCTRLN